MMFSIIGYDPVGAWKNTAETIDEILKYRNPAGITWININGLDDAAALNRLAEIYRIHPLTIEDIRDSKQRPKAEEFDDYLFITFKAVNRKADEENRFEQISIILKEDTVITFHERAHDSFDPIRRRILDNAGKIRRLGADYLAYAVMDSIVDEYYLVLDDLAGVIDEFEERAVDESDEALMTDFQSVKQNLLRVKRVVSPLRESLASLMRMETPLINPDLEHFFKDLYDNTVRAAETVENCRELLAGVMEVHLASMSNRMNKVMKVLTIISTIFIPLTFIVGVYGMNFRFMPELEMQYAYFVVWGVMVVVAVGMLALFKRRNWL